MLPFSRTSGTFLQVIADDSSIFFDVETTWNCDPNNCQRAKLHRNWHDTGAVRLIKPSDKFTAIHIMDKDIPEMDIDELAQKIANKINKKMEEVSQLLSELDSIKCALGTKGEADFAFRIFGTGLGMNLSISLLKEGRLIKMGSIGYDGIGKPIKFIWIKDVACKLNEPYRLENLTLREFTYDQPRKISLHLNDLSKSIKENWEPSFWHPSSRDKMICIDGYYSHQRAAQYFEDKLISGGSFISNLSLRDQRIFINLIINKLAFFKRE